LHWLNWYNKMLSSEQMDELIELAKLIDNKLPQFGYIVTDLEQVRNVLQMNKKEFEIWLSKCPLDIIDLELDKNEIV